MSAIKSYIVERCGPESLGRRAVHRFSFAVPSGRRPALFDPYNKRVKLYGVSAGEFERSRIHAVLQQDRGDARLISKLTVYAYPGGEGRWGRLGLRREGVILGFFPEGVDAHIWAAYTDPARARYARQAEHDQIVELARTKAGAIPRLPAGYRCHVAAEGEAAEIAELLRAAFDDYPTPISAPHIADCIARRANHFRVVRNGRAEVVATASAEIDHERGSAEMTDCATRPQERGQGLMACLLRELGRDMARTYGIGDLYTLARAGSVGMNCVFGKLGWRYTGRLIKNCCMPGGWESMNIWCKAASGRGRHQATQ